MSKNWNTKVSPKKYVKLKGRSLPLGKCYVNKDWKETGMAYTVVTRRHPDGHVTFGAYLVDILARGTKDCFCNIHFSKSSFRDFLKDFRVGSESEVIEIDYVLAHNIIYGGNAFAEDFGFEIHPDFKYGQFILKEDTDDIPLIEIEFGIDGEPLLTH